MAFRPLKTILCLALFTGLTACGTHSSNSGQHSFNDPAADAPAGADAGADGQSPSQKSETPQIITEKTDIPLQSFEMPKALVDHLNASEQPELVQKPSTGFSVYNQYIQIDPKTSVLTFAGVLRIKGQKDEAIQLSCTIDKAKAWSCNNMFPVDAKIAAQRRLQATARCVDANICKQVGVKLFVLIKGKIETQSFFSYKFQAWKASSGDTDEEIEAAQPAPTTPAVETPATDPVVLEKPTPQETEKPPVKFDAPVVQQEPALTDEEIALILNNEGWEQESETTAVEYSAPVNTPSPGGGQTSIPDIQQQFPQMNKGVRDQAMGFHNRGSLALAKALPATSTGIVAKSPGVSNYGTDLTVSMLKAAAKEVDRVVPGKAAFRVTSIAAQYGGHMKPHSSHQTGLDIDVGFPSTDKSTVFGAACSPLVAVGGSKKCADGATVSDAFDEKRFYLFLKSMNCAENAPVMAMFLDKRLKKHMCAWAKNNLSDLDQKNSCTAKIFRALHHENGHYNHVHIRLKCPGNESCSQNMIPLQAGTGC